ncbi:MAG: PfkB family carbohydrate kinase, partial [Pseudomonadota bacterium]|nr:PfkB family carbohydrate kinase [Pseudomonadota bacterium]
MNASFAAEALVALQNKSVLVVGDVMLDRFIDGSVSRISPEAPVPVLEKSRETEMPGGAANVATNLASLGCEVRLVAVTGTDTQGHRIAGLLGANMAIDFHQVIDPDRPTTTKTRFRADGQQVLRFDEEVTNPISAPVRQQLMDTFGAALAHADLVIISDYAKGCVPPDMIAEITAAT